MKPNLTLLTALLLVPLICFGDDSTMHLQVSPNGRFLQYADGTPFFYLADTAWMLTNKLTEEEARRLFADRSAKGFTVIPTFWCTCQSGRCSPSIPRCCQPNGCVSPSTILKPACKVVPGRSRTAGSSAIFRRGGSTPCWRSMPSIPRGLS
jgi:hypothetical protein